MLAQVHELITMLEKERGITMKEVDEQAAKMAANLTKGDAFTAGNGAAGDDEDAWEDDEDGDEFMK